MEFFCCLGTSSAKEAAWNNLFKVALKFGPAWIAVTEKNHRHSNVGIEVKRELQRGSILLNVFDPADSELRKV